MAEILVKAVDAEHSDPQKDARGCYKRGMPVVVMPDGHRWGKKEGLPKFVIIKMPGVPVETVQKYIEPQTEDVISLPNESGAFQVVRRRRWQFRLDAMPAIVRGRVAAAGALTISSRHHRGAADVTWSETRQFLRDLKTGETETEGL